MIIGYVAGDTFYSVEENDPHKFLTQAGMVQIARNKEDFPEFFI